MRRAELVRRFADPPEWLLGALDGPRVVTALQRRRVLGLHVDERVVAAEPLDIRLSRRGWSVWYRATVVAPGTHPHEVTLSGTLTPDAASSEPDDLGPRLDLRVVDADPTMPVLQTLTDPRAARILLARALDAGARSGIVIDSCEPHLVRYAHGARATVVHALRYAGGADPRWPGSVVTKVYGSEEGACTHDAMRALWGTDLSTARDVRIAEPLAYLPDERVAIQSFLGGSTLTRLLTRAVSDRGGSLDDRLREVLLATADALAALHSCGVAAGPERTPASLVRRVHRALDRLSTCVPDLQQAGAALIDPLVRRAEQTSPDPSGPSHGGFRPAQVLVEDQGAGPVGLIDFDGFCRAEPAFDLGRFSARFRELGVAAPGGRTPPLSPARQRQVDAMVRVFLERYARRHPVTPERVALWEELELVTALVQSWTRGQLDRTAPLVALLNGGAGPSTAAPRSGGTTPA